MSMSDAQRLSSTIATARRWRLPRVVQFALRELRSGLSGFGIFIACIALGVAVVTGVGALTDALLSGFEQQGRMLLGGDVTLRRVHRRATSQERIALAQLGRTAETATMRSMARLPDGSDQALIEIKAVDPSYPLLGKLAVDQASGARQAIHGSGGAVVAQSLLDRLGLKVGDRMKIGSKSLPISGVLTNEPDRISARLAFGPRVMVSHQTLASTGLVRPGTLINWRYAILAPDGETSPKGAVERIRAAIAKDLPEAGFIVRDRHNPSPSITRLLNRLRQFLTLLGLAALLIGGVGVANAVQTFVDRRRKTIATYKSIGATNGTVLGIYLVQIMTIAVAGTAIGLLVGSAVPAALSLTYGSELPVALGASFTWVNVAMGFSYGILVALLFVLWPLGQAERIRPAALFRDEVTSQQTFPSMRILLLTGLAATTLVGFAVLTTGAPRLAFGFLSGVFAILILFWAIGTGVTWIARKLPRPRRSEVALAMTGLASPGGLTRSVVLSLGAGLSLLVAVALVDASLISELRGRMPENSPDYFAIDIAKQDGPAFESEIRKVAPTATIETAPMLRGRIVRLNGVPAAKGKSRS